MDAPEQRLYRWLCQVAETFAVAPGESLPGAEHGPGGPSIIDLARAERWVRAISPPIPEVDAAWEAFCVLAAGREHDARLARDIARRVGVAIGGLPSSGQSGPRGARRATTETGERAGTEPGHGPAVPALEVIGRARREGIGAFAAGALGVVVAAAAVVVLVARDEPAGPVADEVPGRLPVTAADFPVCEPAPASQPAAADRARIPMRRRRANVPLDDRTAVVMKTDEGAYEISIKRVNRARRKRGVKTYEYSPRRGEAVELPIKRGWNVVVEGEP